MMTSHSHIDSLLEQFDGKHTDLFDRIAVDFPADESLLLHLVRIAESADSPMQTAATALLKRYHAASAAFTERLAGRLIDLLSSMTHWESRLHLLQMLPSLPIPSDQAAPLYECLQSFLTGPNKFVRAWTYGGLHRLASLYPEYRPQVSMLLAKASREETASVQARLRQLPHLERHRSTSHAKKRPT